MGSIVPLLGLDCKACPSKKFNIFVRPTEWHLKNLDGWNICHYRGLLSSQIVWFQTIIYQTNKLGEDRVDFNYQSIFYCRYMVFIFSLFYLVVLCNMNTVNYHLSIIFTISVTSETNNNNSSNYQLHTASTVL